MSNYELAEKDYKAGMKYKDIANKYGVTINTVKSWKQRYNWTKEDAEKKKKVCTQKEKSVHTKKKSMHTKSKKAIARALIKEGASISEAANQSELHLSTVKRLSSKENLQQSQLEYLKSFREMMKEKIRANKLKRLSLNEEALYSIEEEITGNNVSKSTFEKIKLSEEIEQLIFEVNRIDRLEKLELEKLKANSLDKKKDKTGSFLDKLEEFI